MLYLFLSYVLINYTLSLIQTFNVTKIECGWQVDRWDYDKIKGFLFKIILWSVIFCLKTEQAFTVTKGMFTLDVCVCICGNINVKV